TGSAASIIPENLLLSQFTKIKYEPVQLRLRTYNGTNVPVKGRIMIIVQHEGAYFMLPLVVAKADEQRPVPTLLGQNCLEHTRLNWAQ
ncbi:hypothetical protein IscW_ISCW000308, partial [Ixodes scapularis]